MSSALDRVFTALCRTCAFVIALIPLVAVMLLATRCVISWQVSGPGALLEPVFMTAGFTIAVAAGTALLGGSLGIGAAFLSHELAPAALRKMVETSIAFLRCTPSVGFGWLGVAVVAPALIAVIRGPFAPFAAAVVLLSLMEAPTAAILVLRALRRVPESARGAAAAAGATPLQTMTLVLVPALRRRIASAYVACFGRACGEAAALLLLFIAIAKIGFASSHAAVAPMAHTMSTLALEVSLPSFRTGGGEVSGLALLIAIITAACALWTDRDYRGRQWV